MYVCECLRGYVFVVRGHVCVCVSAALLSVCMCLYPCAGAVLPEFNKNRLGSMDGMHGLDSLETKGVLTSQQLVQCLKDGEHMLFTGCAGSGKSHLLTNAMTDLFHEAWGAGWKSRVLFTSTTGISAQRLREGGGKDKQGEPLLKACTVHSALGLGFGATEQNVGEHVKQLRRDRPNVIKRWCVKSLTIIIDEAPFMRGNVLRFLWDVGDEIRRNAGLGGMAGVQFLFAGDFLQLPPIVKPEEWKAARETGKAVEQYIFEAARWEKLQRIKYVLLRGSWRHKEDTAFYKMLDRIATGFVSEGDDTYLRSLAYDSSDKAFEEGVATRLYFGKPEAWNHNNLMLQRKAKEHLINHKIPVCQSSMQSAIASYHAVDHSGMRVADKLHLSDVAPLWRQMFWVCVLV